MVNLAEENLKWSLRENHKGVFSKLVWNKRGRSKNLKSRRPRPRLTRSEDPKRSRDSDSCSSGEDRLSVPSYKTNKDGNQIVQKRVKSKSPSKQRQRAIKTVSCKKTTV